MKSRITLGAALVAGAALASPAFAGTFKTITIDGSSADWAGVPVLVTDPTGDASPIDVGTVQIANDANNLYLRITYPTAINPNAGPSTFLAFDTDNNLATGYDIYGLGRVGSDLGFQNDFPFAQTATTFNSGGASAGASISPYNAVTTEQEFSIPRNLTYTTGGQTVFGSSFTLMVWTDGASADATAAIPYAFAAVPEPMSLSAVAGVALMLRRRRRA